MNDNTSVAIVDDNRSSIKYLFNSLYNFSNITVVGTAQTANAGKKIIMQQHPELLFQDIELPDMSGLEMLREIQDQITWPMQVVFYTAYDKYLLDALRQSAFDYLLKPFEKDELDQVMNRFFNFKKRVQNNISFHNSLTKLLPNESTFMISTVDGFQIIRIEQIGYFKYQNDRKQWVFFLTDLSELQMKRNTSAKDILNYSSSFVQINRDQIININYLSMVKGKECILLPPFDQAKGLTANRKFIGQLLERFSLM